ncbi:MAG: leader peptide processing enzyme [Treponema sp.]|nr:leader peptide processing enzyme [Treponema sp.]
MNKKINTLLFVAGATLFNILITVLAFIILIVISSRLINWILPDGIKSDEIVLWQFILSFIGGMVLSFFIYRFAIKFLMKKIDADKYFAPIFSGRRR